MKKYIMPSAQVVKLHTSNILAGSMGFDGGNTNTMDTKRSRLDLDDEEE